MLSALMTVPPARIEPHLRYRSVVLSTAHRCLEHSASWSATTSAEHGRMHRFFVPMFCFSRNKIFIFESRHLVAVSIAVHTGPRRIIA